jgi:hypothetical protein
MTVPNVNLPPHLMPTPEMLRQVISESERPIRQWLDRNKAQVRGWSLNAATAEVLKQVPGAANQGVGTVRAVIQDWARQNSIQLPAQSLVPHPADTLPPSDSSGSFDGLVSAIKSAVKTAKDGVSVESGPASVRISVSGVTGRLGPADLRAEPTGVRAGVENELGRMEAGVSWAGKMHFATNSRGFHFNASLASDRWSATLTFPSDEMPADFSTLGDVFSSAENGMRGVAAATGSVRSLNDLSDAKNKISPHIDPIKEAVTTAANVASTPSGVSFGIRVSGPGYNSGPNDQGHQVTAVMTIRF